MNSGGGGGNRTVRLPLYGSPAQRHIFDSSYINGGTEKHPVGSVGTRWYAMLLRRLCPICVLGDPFLDGEGLACLASAVVVFGRRREGGLCCVMPGVLGGEPQGQAVLWGLRRGPRDSVPVMRGRGPARQTLLRRLRRPAEPGSGRCGTAVSPSTASLSSFRRGHRRRFIGNRAPARLGVVLRSRRVHAPVGVA